MEKAGKDLDDEELKRAMRSSGLGTPATRASIIETLLRRQFIVRDKKKLLSTERGQNLIAAVPVAELKTPQLTGEWEARLAQLPRATIRDLHSWLMCQPTSRRS